MLACSDDPLTLLASLVLSGSVLSVVESCERRESVSQSVPAAMLALTLPWWWSSSPVPWHALLYCVTCLAAGQTHHRTGVDGVTRTGDICQTDSPVPGPPVTRWWGVLAGSPQYVSHLGDIDLVSLPWPGGSSQLSCTFPLNMAADCWSDLSTGQQQHQHMFQCFTN